MWGSLMTTHLLSFCGTVQILTLAVRLHSSRGEWLMVVTSIINDIITNKYPDLLLTPSSSYIQKRRESVFICLNAFRICPNACDGLTWTVSFKEVNGSFSLWRIRTQEFCIKGDSLEWTLNGKQREELCCWMAPYVYSVTHCSVSTLLLVFIV